MTEIFIGGEALDLPAGFTFDIEDTSPVFNDRGPQSLPVTVPATARNSRLLGWPQRMDTGRHPAAPEIRATVRCGAVTRFGTVNVTEAGPEAGITLAIGFDNSSAYALWAERRLKDLADLPVVRFGSTGDAFAEMNHCIHDPYPTLEDYAVFPIGVTKEERDGVVRWEILNRTPDAATRGSLARPRKVRRWIDGTDTDLTVPDCYGITPFLHVWRVLELVFADLGLRLESNPVKDDPDLCRLVVLNNTADAIVTGTLRYSELMPDCTVQEFLNSLWCRFGLVYAVDETRGTARLRLLRDILRSPAAEDMTCYCAGPATVTWEERQYVKMSARKGIEGAEPACATFEEFSKGLDVSRVAVGNDAEDWDYDNENDAWDGDQSYWMDDHDPDDPDYPDPPDPDYPDYPDFPDDYDDGRDERQTRAAEGRSPTETATTPRALGRETVTGNWFRLDEFNGFVRRTSSPFFDWDPQPAGLEPLELTADDECVPVGGVTDQGYEINCPHYLYGARHYHSYIAGADNDGETGDSTPLAFMFAFELDGGTVGRHTAETDNGSRYLYPDGSRPRTSLLFQFADGLFANFWRDYDEILRHGNRSVTQPAAIPMTRLSTADMLAPVTLRGIRCLPDTLAYDASTPGTPAVEMTLRTIQTAGDYDIEAERHIPSFPAVYTHLEWKVKWSTLPYVAGYGVNESSAAGAFIALHGDHAAEDDQYVYKVNGMSAVPVETTVRPDLNPENDDGLPEIEGAGQRCKRTYPCTCVYDIHLARRRKDDPSARWEPIGAPLGRTSIETTYDAQLVVRRVAET